jgi:hypothetical protein
LVAITRYGKVVARLTPERDTEAALPDLAAFRESIRVKPGKRLDDMVQKSRDEHRFWVVYLDTSVLYPNYLPESRSAQATAVVMLKTLPKVSDYLGLELAPAQLQ